MLRLMIAVALALSAVAAPASAQTAAPAVWTEPHGVFTLRFADREWAPIDPPLPGSESLLDIEWLAGNRRNVMRMCSVLFKGNFPAPPGLTQAQSNLLTENFDEQNVLNAVPGARDVTVAHSVIDGVGVADFEFLVDNLYQRWLMFFVLRDGQAAGYQIVCGGGTPMPDADSAEIEAVLRTLHFVRPS